MVGNGGVMRITDLLDSRSVMLGAAPSDKKQTLEQAVALMVKSGKIADEEAYKKQVLPEKRSLQQESAKE